MVVVIIGIIASVTVPRMAKALAVQRVQAAAKRIAADLALAQRQARITSTTRQIGFAVGSNTYALSNVRHLDRAAGAYYVDLADEPYGVTLVSASFGVDSCLSFDGYGVPDSGGSVVISCGAVSFRVMVAADTGAVTVARIVEAEPETDPEPLPKGFDLPGGGGEIK